jgi:hypothetical protein
MLHQRKKKYSGELSTFFSCAGNHRLDGNVFISIPVMQADALPNDPGRPPPIHRTKFQSDDCAGVPNRFTIVKARKGN